jgi:parallel beta-helix repeat protein
MTLRAVAVAALWVFVCAVVPAEAKSKVTKVEVANFGAVPDDGKSDTTAVLAAIDECRKHKPVVLKFDKGRYDFFAEEVTQGQYFFTLSGLSEFAIDGNCSTFMLHGRKGAFVLGNCNSLAVRNLTIDYSRPPFSVGQVIAVNGTSFDVDVEPKYPVTGKEAVEAYMEYDPKAGHAARNAVDEYYTCNSTELVKPQVMRVNLKHDARIKSGAWVILRHAAYGPGAFYAGNCSDLTLENVNVYTAPGMAFGSSSCTNITVKGFRSIHRPGSGHPMSVTADGFHFGASKGLISIEDCEFEGMGDDAANIKTGLYSKVIEKIDDRTVLTTHPLKLVDPPSQGDTMEVSHPDIVTYATAVAESAEIGKEGVQKIRFKDPLPGDLKIGDFLGNASRVARVRIKNCRVRSNRARGFLLQNRDMIVENCKFTGCTMGGVWVLTEIYHFCESITSRDVIVRNCTFDNCGYWQGSGVLGAFVHTGADSYGTVPGAHKNVLFEGNVIRGTDNCGIFLDGVDGVTLRNNTVEQACREPRSKHGNAAIYVMGCRNVKLEKNTCQATKQGAGCKDAIKFGAGSEMNTVSVRDNVGF